MKHLLFAVLSVGLCGCAYMHSTTISYGPDGKPTGNTRATVYAVFDSNAQFTRFRNQSSMSGTTNNQYAPGTYVAGLNESSTSTNAVATLNALANVLGKIPW